MATQSPDVEKTKPILVHLRRQGWLEQRTGRWFASTQLMDLGEKGRIHSNIPDSRVHQVVDADSGRIIGRVAGVFDNVFVLAQQPWQVVSVSGDVIRVRRFKGRASAPLFQPIQEHLKFNLITNGNAILTQDWNLRFYFACLFNSILMNGRKGKSSSLIKP